MEKVALPLDTETNAWTGSLCEYYSEIIRENDNTSLEQVSYTVIFDKGQKYVLIFSHLAIIVPLQEK